MEQIYTDTYTHTAGGDAGVAAGGIVSTDIVTDHNLEMKDEHDKDATARPSEIEANQALADITGNSMQMRRMETQKNEIEVLDDYARPQLPIELPSRSGGDDVYVAVGKSDSISSLDALSWALKNVVKPRSIVYLIHVRPEVHQIPTPLGPLPKSQVSEDLVISYMNRERQKTGQMLEIYLNLCRTFMVACEVHLLESKHTENAILEFIPVLNIQLLVIGTSRSKLRSLRRGGTKAGIIQRSAPQYCEVKIICEGEDISTITSTNQTPPVSPLPPEASPPPELHSMSTNGSINSRKENIFKKLLRFFSCKRGIDVHMN